MSRIAKQPIVIPKGVDVKIKGSTVDVKGPNASLSRTISNQVEVKTEDGEAGASTLVFRALNDSNEANALAGTARANVNNMIVGVTEGFEKKLELLGVGYRAKAQGNKIDVTAGFSHPVVHILPEGVTAESPSQTEILLKGADRQKVSQEAAKIRAIRPPECYKGKGIRYSGEQISLKETKKK